MRSSSDPLRKISEETVNVARWQRGRTRSRTVTDRPSLLARIERAIYRLQHTHGLPLQPLGDGSDAEVVLARLRHDHIRMRRVLCDLREAILEQVGTDQTDRLRHALADAVKALSA